MQRIKSNIDLIFLFTFFLLAIWLTYIISANNRILSDIGVKARKIIVISGDEKNTAGTILK